MNQLLLERRDRHRRNQKRRPLGLLVGMLTASVVTLICVFSDVEPLAILIRAALSSVLMGSLISVGLGIIRTANNKT